LNGIVGKWLSSPPPSGGEALDGVAVTAALMKRSHHWGWMGRG
jgi:hypothetical protein